MSVVSTTGATAELRNQERLALLTLRLAHNVKLEQALVTDRRINRMTCALAAVAGVVASYDLVLLRMG